MKQKYNLFNVYTLLNMIYLNVFQAADYKFEFCVQNDKGTGLAGNWVESDPEMVPFRRVLIFTLEKFHAITNTLASFLEPAGTVYNSAYEPGSI